MHAPIASLITMHALIDGDVGVSDCTCQKILYIFSGTFRVMDSAANSHHILQMSYKKEKESNNKDD